MGGLFQLSHPGGRRILTAHPAVECTLFGLYAVVVGGQSRRPLVHAHKGNARLLFQILGHQKRLADGGMREVGHVRLCASLVDQLFTEYLHRSSFNPKSKAL